MKIWVVRSTYERDHYVSTHLTDKGAYMRVINEMGDYCCGGLDEDEIEEMAKDLPTNPEEDLRAYNREQLRGYYSDWMEYMYGLGMDIDFEVYETQVGV